LLHYSHVLSGGGWDFPESESLKVQQLLFEQFDERSETSLLLLFQDRAAKAGEQTYNDKLTKMIDFLGKEEGIESTYTLLNAAESIKPRMESDDGHTRYAFINMNVVED
jgi:hypothetical protein